MKDYSNFVTEKRFPCDVEGCSLEFVNDDQLAVHKKRHDMILNLGLGQKGTTFTDQTPTPTQFIRNCEEVGLFQDLQNVNPFEETFKKAVEAVKSGQLTLEKSLQSVPADDTLHTPNVFPHITDVPSVNPPEICNKSENIPPCGEDLLKQDISESEKVNLTSQPGLEEIKKENIMPFENVDKSDKKLLDANNVKLNVPECHLVQLFTPPEDPQNSCNMVVVKDAAADLFSPLPVPVKEKLKKNLRDKKTGRTSQHKVPILKCVGKRTSPNNKFSKFSKNAMKLISKLETSGENEGNDITSARQKKISKILSKESRSEFLARSRAASSRCREKKKMYLLYLEKVNSELSTANQNLLIINSLLRQEISQLHHELLKHKNCNAADKNTEAALAAAANFIGKKSVTKKEKVPESRPRHEKKKKTEVSKSSSKKEFLSPFSELVAENEPESPTDPNLFSFDVAEVILNDEPEESEIPLNEGNKPPDIIVRFNSVGNDFPETLPLDCTLDRYIKKAGGRVKQIYGEHSYYFRKYSGDIDKRIMNYKTFRNGAEPPINSEECKKLNTLQIQMKQDEAFRDLTSLNSKVFLGSRTPPPLILLKPFKKRSVQNKRNEKT